MGLTTYDAKDPDTKYPPIRELRPPAGAPNVLIVLIDDVGFGATSVFGGPCQTPNFEKLAANGLKYNRFHATALCSPTRQALLTGRNHHSAGMGGITEIATSVPGYNSLLPNTIWPLEVSLQLLRRASVYDREHLENSTERRDGDAVEPPMISCHCAEIARCSGEEIGPSPDSFACNRRAVILPYGGFGEGFRSTERPVLRRLHAPWLCNPFRE